MRCQTFPGCLKRDNLPSERLQIFYTLKEAQVIIEGWRQEYNTFRPHSSLGYQSPAPEAVMPPSDMIIEPWIISKGLVGEIIHGLT
ncbi:integrase core domain-containing protein [Thermodesulfobacteriota bacterium]